jgi:undecaprenyl-diphosphatase
MNLLQALVLGLVQGATEFIPVSSSGHLVLIPWILGWRLEPQAAFVFDVLVQWGTLVALVVFYWRDLVALVRAVIVGLARRRPLEDPLARLGWLIAAASVPAAIAGLLFKEAVESAFNNPAAVSAFLLGTALLLLLSERLSRQTRALSELTLADALWVGLAQALALLPGISRSGSTIAGGLTRGLRRAEAARLSFLMFVPVMLGAGVIALKDLADSPAPAALLPVLAVGFLTSAVVGYLAIRWLLGYLSRRPLTPFALYCLVVGVAGLLLSVLRG